MTKFFSFISSDLFLSLAGGFALGVAALVLVDPAVADMGDTVVQKSISVEAPAAPVR